MYKNNEITDDDTAHKNAALKKDVFFSFYALYDIVHPICGN